VCRFGDLLGLDDVEGPQKDQAPKGRRRSHVKPEWRCPHFAKPRPSDHPDRSAVQAPDPDYIRAYGGAWIVVPHRRRKR
jgi:hypothetical protein